MKLSEMTVDQAADVLVRIADPAAAIMNDPKLDTLINALTEMKKPTELQQLSYLMFKVLPFMLGNHRAEAYTIIAALTGKTEQEIASESIKELAVDIRSSYDQELLDFFRSSKETPNE